MKKYLSHRSAAFYWNIPHIEAVLGSQIDEPRTVDFTVAKSSERFQTKECNIYLCQAQLPRGAVVKRDGVVVASPEFAFLQLAPKLNIHTLILLGLQLCSHPPGKPSQAITTKKKLGAFVKKASGHRGQIKALRAIKYIEDGSASIMESVAYMILTLPHALGGYGIKNPVFNFEITLKEYSSKRLGQHRCFVDLYYKSEKLAVEHDSFAFHNSPSKQGQDSIRSVILNRHGIEVMHLKTIQLYDKNACEDFAFQLAHRLGKRIQIRSGKFDEMNRLLRTLLPTNEAT